MSLELGEKNGKIVKARSDYMSIAARIQIQQPRLLRNSRPPVARPTGRSTCETHTITVSFVFPPPSALSKVGGYISSEDGGKMAWVDP